MVTWSGKYGTTTERWTSPCRVCDVVVPLQLEGTPTTKLSWRLHIICYVYQILKCQAVNIECRSGSDPSGISRHFLHVIKSRGPWSLRVDFFPCPDADSEYARRLVCVWIVCCQSFVAFWPLLPLHRWLRSRHRFEVDGRARDCSIYVGTLQNLRRFNFPHNTTEQFDKIDVRRVLQIRRPSHRDMDIIFHTLVDNYILFRIIIML